MRGIPEDNAIEIGEQIDSCKYLECSVKEWLRDECEELNPWLPIDEFLKSGFIGLFWICLKGYPLTYARFSDGEFDKDDVLVNDKLITHVQPIHKPEPPR